MRKLFLLLLGFLLFVAPLWAQRTISGKVTDEKGSPVPNVSIIVKGTTTGTTSKSDGSYTLVVPANAKALVFSSVDMRPVEMPIGAQSAINVALTAEDRSLQEVVVTGYTRERKREYTSAASVMQSKVVDAVPVAALDQMFQGRVPGLVANSGNGQPGASANVHIRGISSISSAFAQPLYVIDGVPLNSGDLNTLNPNDIESITILKDAGSAALYGSRGSLGVIVITTKRGKAGQTNFQFRTQVGFTQRPQPSQFDQMNSREMLEYEGFVGSFASGLTAPGWAYSANNPANAGLPATSPANNPFSPSKARYAFLLDSLGSITTDFYDVLFKTGISQTHEINMSGGNSATRYYFSLNHFNQEGTDRKSHLKRYTARFNLDNTVGKLSLQFNSSLNYGITDYNEGAFYATNGTANPFSMVWRAKPYENPYRADGSLIYGASTVLVPKAIGNLIERSDNSTWIDRQIKLNAGLVLSYKIFPNITLMNTTGLDGSNSNGEGAINPLSYVGSLQTYQAGYLNESNSNRIQLVNTSAAIYGDRFGKHNVEFGAYFEVLRQWSRGFGFTLYNLDPRLTQTGQGAGTLPTNGAATIAQNGNTAKSGYGIRSYFGSAKYSWDNKYTLTGIIRRDGTSRILLDENKQITTWSAGLAWDAMKENFMNSQNVLTDLRLRASYGRVPNISSIPGGSFAIGSNFYSIPSYLGAQQPSFSATSYAGSTITGQAPGLSNPTLKMETVAKHNIGVDLGFWKNRVRVTADFYKSMTEDLFVNQQMVATSGFGGSSLAVNAGSMSNKGVEVDLTVDIIKNRNMDLTFKFNHSLNENEIVDLGKVTEYTAGTGIIKKGLPYGTHYSYWYLGADPATGRPQYKKPDGSITTNINEAGQFHEFGTWFPKHVGGFSMDMRYQKITVSAFFSYQFDVMRYNNIQNWVTQGDATYTGAVSQSRRLLTDQWRRPGDVKMIQAPNYSRQFTSYDITDAKFLRFRNLTVAYNIPELAVSGIRLIKSGRFYIMGQNLAIWSPWSGLDPEDDNNISLAEFPNAKAIVVGLDINF
jgi:TonB-linked SusC/RagA family outer membrane protein